MNKSEIIDKYLDFAGERRKKNYETSEWLWYQFLLV